VDIAHCANDGRLDVSEGRKTTSRRQVEKDPVPLRQAKKVFQKPIKRAWRVIRMSRIARMMGFRMHMRVLHRPAKMLDFGICEASSHAFVLLGSNALPF